MEPILGYYDPIGIQQLRRIYKETSYGFQENE